MGSGDGFAAGALTEYLRSDDLTAAVRFGHQVASKSIKGDFRLRVFV
jgi:sugar/nucleoside kinase (ribokinase family)